jgi:hypothetical protein
MSDTQTHAPARRSAAKLNMDKLGDVLAPKGQPPAPPAGAEQRGAAPPASPAPVTPEAAPAESKAVDPNRMRPKGISTSLEVPPYLMENIAAYLRANGGHNMRTLLFTGLTKLGIHVDPQDLVPQRQRRAR